MCEVQMNAYLKTFWSLFCKKWIAMFTNMIEALAKPQCSHQNLYEILQGDEMLAKEQRPEEEQHLKA